MTNRLDYSPGVDLVTGKAAIMLQDRAVIGLSAWLVDAARAAAVEGRTLQLVTPAGSRLTRLARTELFRRRGCTWVVREPDTDELYDGLRGVRLAWDEEQFAPVLAELGGRPVLSPAWLAETELTACLQVVARVRYQPLDSAVVGTATEWLFRELSGAAPLGWGTEEPVSQPWRTDQVTSFCRRRMPDPSWLVVAGRAAVGSIEVHHRPAGLEETVTLSVAQPGLELPASDELSAVVDRLAREFELVSVAMTAHRAAPDTSVPPRFTGVPAPIGVGVGPADIATIGIDAAVSIDGHDGRAVGPSTAAGVWYPVGDGRDVTGWTAFGRLLKRLAGAGLEGPNKGITRTGVRAVRVSDAGRARSRPADHGMT